MRREFYIEGGLAPYTSPTPAVNGSPWKATRLMLSTACLLLLSACDLAPDFKMPELALPDAFKSETAETATTVEPANDGKWKRVDDTARIVEFAWWRMFNDAALNALMEQAMKDNPSLEVALQRVKSARAAAGDVDADLYPAIELGAGPERSRSAAASVNANAPNTTANIKPHTFYRANGTITYELDLFGRNRNRSAAAWFDATGEEDNYLAARLSLQAELAQAYFRLAALTEEDALLTRTLATREQSLALTRKKYDVGAADALVLSSAESDLANVKAQAATVRDEKTKAENALAVLVGATPSTAKLPTPRLAVQVPAVPAGLPSSLLERRPDIKRAVESMKAANARIGVARTGYFPEISLSAMGGFVSTDLEDLFKWSNRTWAIGPMAGTILTQPIFEGGRIAAARAQSDAEFNGAVANYRASVLQAFREVEDQLSGLASANARVKATTAGAAAATRAYQVAGARFKAGYSSHLEYLDAERSKLAADRASIQVRGDQFVTTVQLVKALGGSWQAPVSPVATGDVPKVTEPAAPPPSVPAAKEPIAATPAPAPAEAPAPKAEPAPSEKPAVAESPEKSDAAEKLPPEELPASDAVNDEGKVWYEDIDWLPKF